MADITLAVAEAAQARDITACAAVVEVTNKIIGHLAREHAGRIATNAASYRIELTEEFESIGRLAVWEHISKWDGRAAFTTYMHGYISGAIADAGRAIVSPGADNMALKCFARMLKLADGDVILAERLCTTLPKAGERLSPDRANAARIAFVGTTSVDTPRPDGTTLADTLADLAEDLEVPAELVTAADITASQRKARRALVNAVLSTMSPRQREVLRARCGFDPYPGGETPFGKDAKAQVHGMSSAEVAAVLGISPDAEKTAWKQGAHTFAGRFPITTAYGA